MEIKISQAGKLMHESPQQKWHGDSPDIMQVSRFAGHEMMVIQKSDDEPDKYELHYMGYMITDLNGIEQAINDAPEFAKTVLRKLSDTILE